MHFHSYTQILTGFWSCVSNEQKTTTVRSVAGILFWIIGLVGIQERLSKISLTFTLPLGCSSSVTDTLSCCSRLFTSLEQQTLTALCTCDALYSENVLLSITSKRPVPLWMRLARRLMSMALLLVGPFSPAMMSEGCSGRPGSQT